MILFFDTETTGVPKDYNAPSSRTDNWPRLVQLGFLLHSDQGKELASGNFIIKPDGFIIPEQAAAVHGITTGKAEQEGVDLNDVLEIFYGFISQATKLVAHNIKFDIKIIGAEYIRSDAPDPTEGKERYCTMLASTPICKIPGPIPRAYKWPKLVELHTFLFGEGFEGAHDAMADIQATARCYWKIQEIAETNREIELVQFFINPKTQQK